MISGEEFESRLHVISQMRDLILGLRQSAMEAYESGKSPYRPAYDERSDYDYWCRVANEKQNYNAASSSQTTEES